VNWFQLFIDVFNFFEYAIIVYVAAINSIYLLLMVIGYVDLRRYAGTLTVSEREALLRSTLVPAISILVPAHNEAATIRDSVRSMLSLRYPRHTVIVINDGSTDDTLQILFDEFQLYRSSRQCAASIPTKPIRGIYESKVLLPLIVVDKENGGKSDALNVGLNVARTPLVAVVDSDSLLESDALLLAAKPFLTDDRTLATGGIIRVANGCKVEHGIVQRVAVPASWLVRFQIVEYLRSFLGGRVAFSFLRSLLIISGAFGLFRRDAVVTAGGFSTSTVGEDMDLVLNLHQYWKEKKADYRIVFVPDPVGWTEVPEDWRTLYRQRNRWQRGTVECVKSHLRMVFRPRYGAPGLFGLPYFAAFEMVGPVIELLGTVLTLAGLALGLIVPRVALLFFVVSVCFGFFLSASAILLEGFTMKRYSSAGDIGRLLMAAIIETFGFRQLLAVWRAKGLIDGLRGKKGWGEMERRGFRPSAG
jgi:cellulose synthase/poly-beta-1,6-N-acetylglucosamine synthase-like glycosyltransferase